MPSKFNLTSSRGIRGMSTQKLDDLLRLLEFHVRFDGSDIERAEYEEGILHLYPPAGAQMTLGEEFQVHSIGDDREKRSLTVIPFLESHEKRTYLGLRISIEGNDYALHRIDKAPLRPA